MYRHCQGRGRGILSWPHIAIWREECSEFQVLILGYQRLLQNIHIARIHKQGWGCRVHDPGSWRGGRNSRFWMQALSYCSRYRRRHSGEQWNASTGGQGAWIPQSWLQWTRTIAVWYCCVLTGQCHKCWFAAAVSECVKGGVGLVHRREAEVAESLGGSLFRGSRLVLKIIW